MTQPKTTPAPDPASDSASDSDKPTPTTPSSQNEQTTTSKRRRVMPVLFWAAIASLTLHLAPLLTLIKIELSADADVDFEWFGQVEDLKGLGHGADDRWAKLSDTAQPEPEQPPAPEQPPEPPAEPTPEPQPKAPEPKPQDPKPKPRPKKPKPQKPPELAIKTQDPKPTPPPTTPEAAPQTEQASPQDTPTAPTKDGLSGLERQGPSKLPTFKNYAPGNARMTALIRLDRLRNTPLEEPTRKMLSVVPDYRILLEGLKFDPIKQLDTIFMASADPRYLQETFLAIRHELSTPQVKTLLSERFDTQLDWRSYRGFPIRDLVPTQGAYQDPRQLLLGGKGLVLVTRPEWLTQLTAKPTPDAKTPEDNASPEAALPMLDGLARIEDAAQSNQTLALVSAQGLVFFFPGYGRLPRFEAVRLELANIKAPTLTIDLQFANAQQAEGFVRDCPKIKKGIINAIPGATFLGLNVYVDKLKCEQSDTYATVHGEYTQKELLRAMALIQPFIPRPPALETLPKAPIKTPPTPEPAKAGADMGITPDMGAKTPDTEPKPAAEPTPDMGAASPQAPPAPEPAPEPTPEPAPEAKPPTPATQPEPAPTPQPPK